MILFLLTALTVIITIQFPFSQVTKQGDEYAGQEIANKSRYSTRLRVSDKHSNTKEGNAKEDYGE